MRNIKILLLSVFVGLASALTYFIFEALVAGGIELIWEDVFNTDKHRLLVLPLAVLLGLIYFYAQHRLDKSSENKANESMTVMPKASVKNYLIVLIVGFFSLVAGASLGPEAVLIPACLMIGALTADKFTKGKESTQLLLAAGFIGLMASFFHSWFIGILSVFLARKELGVKPSNMLWATGIASSFAAYFMLNAVEGDGYLEAPVFYSRFGFYDVLLIPLLFAGGYALTYGLTFALKYTDVIIKAFASAVWWKHALLASVVLAGLYLIGGSFVEFTGNDSIKPLLHEASDISLLGLIWILIIKIVAIAWSKSSGYRGGLVFPMIFAASVVVALAQNFASSINAAFALLIVVAGVIYANSKNKVLF